ncbi:MAG: MaoC family dehydratase [Firmicutes bacterium]|nr:MaoC family dehydratase [Bacillota bacterium]
MSDKQKRLLRVGDSAQLTKKFTKEDIEAFAELTMDDNGIHTSEEMSAKGIFRRPVVHGVFAGNLISSVMGTKLPGPGTILQEMNCRYTNPVYPGDTITARVVLERVEEQERYYTAILKGTCVNQDGITVAEADFRQLMLKRFFEIES